MMLKDICIKMSTCQHSIEGYTPKKYIKIYTKKIKNMLNAVEGYTGGWQNQRSSLMGERSWITM